MQKVAKERLTTFSPSAPENAPPADLHSISYLLYVLQKREDVFFTQLGTLPVITLTISAQNAQEHPFLHFLLK